jgi:hypothetical protein
MYRPTHADIRKLPDTPFNRRLIRMWAEQDARGVRAQRRLFSQDLESDPETPSKEATSDTAEMTFRIASEDSESDHDETTVDLSHINREIVSRMIAGSSRSRTISGKDICEITLGSVIIQIEFTRSTTRRRTSALPFYLSWLG